jgi:hypothetical protein
MRDRRARLVMVLLILSFPVLIDAMSSGRRSSAEPTGPESQSAAAVIGLGSDLGVELTEAVVAAGLMYAGWQRRRLLRPRNQA